MDKADWKASEELRQPLTFYAQESPTDYTQGSMHVAVYLHDEPTLL